MRCSPRWGLILSGLSVVVLAALLLLRRHYAAPADGDFVSDAAQAYLRRGRALLDEGRAEDALAAFEEARRLDPDAPTVLASLGLGYNRTRRYDQARAVLERSVAARPAFAARLQLAVALAGVGEREEAAARFAALTREFPDRVALIEGYRATMLASPHETPP